MLLQIAQTAATAGARRCLPQVARTTRPRLAKAALTIAPLSEGATLAIQLKCQSRGSVSTEKARYLLSPSGRRHALQINVSRQGCREKSIGNDTGDHQNEDAGWARQKAAGFGQRQGDRGTRPPLAPIDRHPADQQDGYADQIEEARDEEADQMLRCAVVEPDHPRRLIVELLGVMHRAGKDNEAGVKAGAETEKKEGPGKTLPPHGGEGEDRETAEHGAGEADESALDGEPAREVPDVGGVGERRMDEGDPATGYGGIGIAHHGKVMKHENAELPEEGHAAQDPEQAAQRLRKQMVGRGDGHGRIYPSARCHLSRSAAAAGNQKTC